MTTTEKSVKVTLEARLKGGQETAREAKKVKDALNLPADAAKNYQALEKAVGRAAHGFARLQGLVKDLNKSLGSKDGVRELTEQRRELERIGQEVEKLNERKRRARNEERSLSFQRGVVQGMGVGEYFPEQDRAGFYRNLGGRFVGSGIRRAAGMASAVGSMPFTGAQGFAQAASGIPLVGGFLSGQLQTGLSLAHQGIEFRRQQAEMAQFQGPEGFSGIQRARRRGASRVAIPGVSSGLAIHEGEMARAASLQGAGGMRFDPVTGQLLPTDPDESLGQRAADDARRASVERQRRAIDRAITARERAADDAEQRLRDAPFQRFQGMGVGFGLNAQASLQSAAGFMGTAGIGMGAMGRGTNLAALEAGMGAQARFGIGVDVAGAFTRGAGSGAIHGDATQELTKAVASGVGLGMSGSDLVRYVTEIAQQLMAFDQTGVRISHESIQNLERGLAQGMSGTRAASVAGQLQQAGLGVGMQGPQSAVDMLLFQELGGFKGGGIKDYFEAAKRMQTGNFVEGGLQNAIKRISTVGTPEGNALAVQSMLQKRNISVNLDEAMNLAQGRGVEEFQNRLAEAAPAKQDILSRGLAQAGKDVIPDVLRRQAATENMQLGAGTRMIGPAQDLERVSASMVANFSKFSGEIQKLTGWAVGASKDVTAVIERIRSLLDTAEQKLARN